jgi:hypothetical protein
MAQLVASEMFQGIKHQEFIKENEGEGDVALVLSELMRELQTDLVVLGTHGRGGVKKVLLGSALEEIVYSALCPVLTVGPGVSPKANTGIRAKENSLRDRFAAWFGKGPCLRTLAGAAGALPFDCAACCRDAQR